MKLETGYGHTGECYEYAYRYVRGNGGILVHGTIEAGYPKRTIEHAWVEIDDYIFEPVENELFERDEYYRIFGAKSQNKYSLHDAMVNTLKYNSFGPWR